MIYFKRRKLESVIYLGICVFMAVIIVANSLVISNIVANSKIGNQSLFIPIVAGVLVYLVLQSVGFYLQGYFSAKYTALLVNDLRTDIMISILSNPRINGDHSRNNVIKTIVTTQLEVVQNSYFGKILWGEYLFIQCIVAIIVALFIKPLFVVIIILLSIPSIIVPVVFRKRIERNREIIISNQENLNLTNIDVIEGFKSIKIFNATHSFYGNVMRNQNSLLQSMVEASRTNAVIDMMSRFFSNFLFMAVWIVGAYFIMNGNMKLSEVVAFTELAGSISVPLNLFLDIAIEYINGKKTFDYLLSFIGGKKGKILEDDNSKGKKNTYNLKTIEYKNIDYNVNNKRILSSLNLTIDCNKKYLITGESGTGKSTILELIFDSQMEYAGDILINGVERKKVEDNIIFENIGYLSQQGYIFDGSIRDNITMFEKDVEDDKIIQLIKTVGLEKWYRDKSLEFRINNTNSNMSGGERQRLLLCRLLYEGKKFIILDEITSGLDRQTTSEIENILLKLEKGVLMVSHNFTTENKAKFIKINLSPDIEG